MPRENKTKYAVLGLLANQPMSGYDIKKHFEEYIGEFWSESYGQIYPITKELVREGLATMTVESNEGKPNRNVFTITEKGMDDLKQWLPKPTDPHKERLEVLMKLTFGAHIHPEQNIELVQRFKEEWIAHINSYHEIEEDLRTTDGENPQFPYWMMAINCGMHLAKAYIAWCDETIETIRSIQKKNDETRGSE